MNCFFPFLAPKKHYALYGVEVDRPSFIPNVSAHDLWESYLPQYAAGFSNTDLDGNPAGGAMATMCSYAGLNGVPSCANDYLLNQVLRKKFNRSNVVVGTDCGAINNMFQSNHYAANSEDAAAVVLNGGSDMELGDMLWSPIANGGQGLLKKTGTTIPFLNVVQFSRLILIFYYFPFKFSDRSKDHGRQN